MRKIALILILFLAIATFVRSLGTYKGESAVILPASSEQIEKNVLNNSAVYDTVR